MNTDMRGFRRFSKKPFPSALDESSLSMLKTYPSITHLGHGISELSDYFGDVFLTKTYFGKYFRKIDIRIQMTNLFHVI